MTTDRTVARDAVANAYRIRTRAGHGFDTPICVYDLAENLGVEVRFVDVPSLEGMLYDSTQPHIILSSLRPMGRRAFTCAHEVGHHCLGHGDSFDEMVERWENQRFDPKEFAADCFAGALLMPKTAVERAFAVRGWTIDGCTPDQAYVISNNFGVGYSTLIHHMNRGLMLLPKSRALDLLKVSRRRAQSMAVGTETSETVWVVDRHWSGRPIDVEAGDLLFLRDGANVEGNCVEVLSNDSIRTIFRAKEPGIARLENGSGWSAFARVSRRSFVGRNVYRHLGEQHD